VLERFTVTGLMWVGLTFAPQAALAAGRDDAPIRIPVHERRVGPSRSKLGPAEPYERQIRHAERTHGVSADLLRAVISVESRYDPRAVSPAGAKGLMQLMPFTARDCGVRDVFDPGQNILGGALYLKRLAAYFHGDLVLTLSAYHAGPANVWRSRGVPESAVTRRYVSDVIGEYARLRARVPQVEPRAVASR